MIFRNIELLTILIIEDTQNVVARLFYSKSDAISKENAFLKDSFLIYKTGLSYMVKMAAQPALVENPLIFNASRDLADTLKQTTLFHVE